MLLILFLLTALSSGAQSWSREFSFRLSYAKLPEGDYLAQALNLVADNNGVSVLGLQFHVAYRVGLSLTSSKAGIPLLRYKVSLQKTSGNTKFHGFNVDTLLVPTRMKAVIHVYRNQKLLDSLTQWITLNREQILLPVSGRVPLSSLYVTFNLVQLHYTKNNYENFVRTTDEINHYYGYRQVMKELPGILQKTSDIHPEVPALLYNYTALLRLTAHIGSHQFPERLHLDKKDPLHFRRAFAATLRKQTRMKTLWEEAVANAKAAQAMQKVTFARFYTGLSIKSFVLSKQYQPYIAGSFREMARLVPGSPELGTVKQASGYFDRNDKPGQATLAQQVYKDFVDAASLYFRRQSYVVALDLLSNASIYEQTFGEVKRIPEFDTLLLQTRDGLASSYLKVAAIAQRQNNARLADDYLKRAVNSLHYNSQTIPVSGSGWCYAKTVQGFHSLALYALRKGELRRALALLNSAENACPANRVTDSLRALTCSGILHAGLATTKEMLLQNHTDEAFEKLMKVTGEQESICHNALPANDKQAIRETAGEIFNRLLASVAHRQVQETIGQAMQRLQNASLLQKKFSLPVSPGLDSLIRQTTVPYLLSLTERANLEVWRKDFDKADSLYKTALQLGRKYGVDNNETVSKALAALLARIKSSGCRWRAEQIRQWLLQTAQAVKAYRISEAESHYLKAKGLAAEIRNCTAENSSLDSTLALYGRLFRFAHAYHRMTQQLFRDGFGAILPQYVRLDTLFRTWQLQKTGLPYTPLLLFVQKQQTDRITQAAVNYFTGAGRFREALRYLLLVSDPAKYEKEQKQIARGFAMHHIVPDQALMNNSAFAVFKRSYQKALETYAK